LMNHEQNQAIGDPKIGSAPAGAIQDEQLML